MVGITVQFTICATLYLFTLSFYIYGFIKWHHWKDHPLLRYRDSKDALFIISIAVIQSNLDIISICLINFDVITSSTQRWCNGIALSLSWTLMFWVYYRTNLIYLTFKQYQNHLSNINIANTNSKSELKRKSVRKHYSSQVLIFCAFPGAVILFLTYIIDGWKWLNHILWLLLYLTGIIIFMAIKIKKVRECLGLLYEMYIVFACIASWWIFTIFAPDLIFLVDLCANHFIAIFILYFTLYLVYKYEGTLTKKDIELSADIDMLSISIRTNSPTTPTSTSPTSPISPTSPTVTDVSHTITNINPFELDDQEQKDAKAESLTLIKYLREQDQYQQFSEYLGLCFCLENLLFIERVCIFRWIVMRLKHNKDISQLRISKNNTDVYSLKFIFLDKIYKEYNDIIGSNQGDFTEIKRDKLWLITNNIWNDFIDEESENEINIPAKIRYRLQRKLKTKDNISEFESFDNFLSLFDDVILNIWKLLTGIYDFRFAKYLNDKTD